MKTATVITAAALALLALPAAAQYRYDDDSTARFDRYDHDSTARFDRYDHDGTARIDRRQEAQERRIERGIETGQLTRQEVFRLRQGQRHIQRLENRALADGRMDRWERRQIEAALDRQSELINRLRHDWHARY